MVFCSTMPRETETKVQKILEVSQKRMPRETESTREKSFKTWKIDSDTMKAAPKFRWTQRRCIFRSGQDLWLHRCRQRCTWTREFQSIKGLFGITRMMIEGNSEIKNVFTADVASSLENPYCLKNKQKKWTKARVYVYSDSVLCLGKCTVQKMCHTFRELQGWMEGRLTSSGRSSQEPQHWTFSTKFKQTHKECTSPLKTSVIE